MPSGCPRRRRLAPHGPADQPDGDHRRHLVRRAAGLGWREGGDQGAYGRALPALPAAGHRPGGAPPPGRTGRTRRSTSTSTPSGRASPAGRSAGARCLWCRRPDRTPLDPEQAAVALPPRRRLRGGRRRWSPGSTTASPTGSPSAASCSRSPTLAAARGSAAVAAAREDPGGRTSKSPSSARRRGVLVDRRAEAVAHEAVEVGGIPPASAISPPTRGGRRRDGKMLTECADPPTALKGELGVADGSPGRGDPAGGCQGVGARDRHDGQRRRSDRGGRRAGSYLEAATTTWRS